MGRHRDEDEEVVVVEKNGSVVGPFLVGMAIGAALGLLFAPMSGAELRADIRDKGRRLKDLATEKSQELQDMVTDGYERARARVEEGLDGARSKLAEGRRMAGDVAEAGKAAAVTAREELERRLAEAREARRAGRPSGDEEPVA
jgi:gas vesicle protein